jgi:tetratricopeptide (TPR) repeat protein
MAQKKTRLAAALLILSSATTSLACLWDSDTLQMERLRFPGVLEIITGKFVRHSRAYYEWRIGDRTKKLETKPNDPALIDDLAVAYAKLGRPEEGIPLLEEVLKEHPDRYETLSNLGTLLFFANRLDDSKSYIRRALEINPDAHFGREKYQLLLTEYLQQSDYAVTGVMRADKGKGFDAYVLDTQPLAKRDEIQKAMTGVLGMMHFADFQSPILLEALGDLLRHGMSGENMTQLAARAYIRASEFSNSKSAAERLRNLAHDSLNSHEDFGVFNPTGDYLVKIDKALDREVADANKWFVSIEANEKRWIAESRDLDYEFAATYYDSLEQTISASKTKVESEWKLPRLGLPGRLLGLFCVLPFFSIVVAIVAWRYWRRQAQPLV